MTYAFKANKGLNKSLVVGLSKSKKEPKWMLNLRLEALKIFQNKPNPTWGADLSALDPDEIFYYLKPLENQKQRWDDLPIEIKDTFEKLGIPKAEREVLAGVGAQFESEIIYKSLREKWQKLGVIFMDINEALVLHHDLIKKYFATVIPIHDNKYAALNSAVWSGGSFVYVPKGVHIDQPLQAYFRINSEQMGQFERTLIIADEGSYVHYVEGCSAPVYRASSLHSAVVEIIVHKNAHVRYTTIQNWSNNVYNLVTKRAIVYENAKMEWVDGNFGSKVTMKYPAIILKGERAQGQIISLAVAGKGQHQDSGGKIVHLAPDTTSNILAKSISKNQGRSSYRGLLKVAKQAHRSKAYVQCDALLFDQDSRSDTYPSLDVKAHQVEIGHEASVSKLSNEQLFYLQSRGLSSAQACAMIVNGFIDCFVKELPMEYAIEINRLIAMEMDGSIG